MKGRRPARQLALQALYEIDLSTHDVEQVLAQRIEDLYRSFTQHRLPEADQGLAERLIAAHAATGFAAPALEDAAAALGAQPEHAAALCAELRQWARQAEYGAAITRGVARNRPAIDAVIARIAPEWPIAQMAPVDRNVLRIALWEIGHGGVPLRVVINEAVELARRFSGEGARRMVNGALGTFVAEDIPLDLILPPDAIEAEDEP